jgi:transcription-repair coupling factor (superfamily II helicase)
MDPGEGPSEFLHLEYADKATLYVPVSQLHLISRYTGVSADEAPLHKLGSGQWEKAKRKAAEQVRDTAAELLNIYARAPPARACLPLLPARLRGLRRQLRLRGNADQQAAIHAVIQDMISPQPMDRLVCGDVGFGKTEVALRAAFVAVHAGKQVALLAPTTLLAEQHYQTIVDRFANWPVKVAELSLPQRQGGQGALEGIADGSIDIVVGTHKLLSKDVQFKRLGLLIIDEEHRFGVRHKEAMKALRAEVDVLTLTATPIPRTLGMALEGLRDLSVIATAPQRRLAIKTFVRNEGKRDPRGGAARAEARRPGLLPAQRGRDHREPPPGAGRADARGAHRRGPRPDARARAGAVMRDFTTQRFNVLLCSTIIETGIDVPSANTIIISRADKFGLAQLHQLRGRVGRSHHQAYAYLLVPDVEGLTKQASQRLDRHPGDGGTGLGLLPGHARPGDPRRRRGAGRQPERQHDGGGLPALQRDAGRGGARAEERQEPDLLSPHSAVFGAATEINLHAPALLPDAYCGDVHTRLNFYKRLATAEKPEQLDRLLEEITDRFGKLPAQGQALFDTHRLRIQAKPYGVVKIDANPKLMSVTFRPNPPVDALRIIELVQKNRAIKLVGNEKLRIDREIADPRERATYLRDLLRSLGQPVKA